jgi:hypothetical protein
LSRYLLTFLLLKLVEFVVFHQALYHENGGRILGVYLLVTRSTAPLLSSNIRHITLGGYDDNPQPFSFNSWTNSINGRTYCVADDIAIYLLSVVDSATSICNFEVNIIGHDGYLITKPFLDQAVLQSHAASSGFQSPEYELCFKVSASAVVPSHPRAFTLRYDNTSNMSRLVTEM